MSSTSHLPLRWIVVTTLLTCLGTEPLLALDPFKPSTVLTAAEPYQGPTAHGDHWVAYQADASHLEVADRTTGEVLRSFELPANTAGRILENNALTLAADGHHLAAAFASRVSVDGVLANHWSVFVWNVATGLPVGSSNLRFEWSYWHKPFVGIANGRLVVASPTQREIRLWEVATLSPLASVVVPDTLLPPLADSSLFQDIVLGGDHLVYFNNGQGQSQIRAQDLIHVNLATGVSDALTQFGDSTYSRHSRPLATDGKHALITYVGQHSVDVECYDLEAGLTRSFRKIPEATSPGLVSPVISASGAWHIGVRKDARMLRLISGNQADAPPASTITLEAPVDEMGDLEFATPESLWFRPGQNPPPGLVAFRQPLNGFPRSVVTVRCQPCSEAQGQMTISVTAKPAPVEPLALHLKTTNGSALAGNDYLPLDVEVTIPAGQETVTLPVTVLQDQVIERHESLFVDITRADAGAVLPESRAAGVIRGSSFNALPPVRPWTADPSHQPAEIALAGGHLLQSNATAAYWPPSTVPAVMLRPFDSGDWSPSTGWNRTTPPRGYHVEFPESRHGRILARDPDVIRVFDPATDEIVHGMEKPNGMLNVPAALGEDHLLTAETPGSLTEYPLAVPHTPRVLPLDATIDAKKLRFLGEFVLAGNWTPLHLLSRADGSPAATIAGPPAWSLPIISTEGRCLAMANGKRAWVRDLERHDDHVELVPHDGRFVRVIAVLVNDGRVFVTGEKREGSPTVEVFEAATGAHLDTLLDDPGALQWAGSPAFDESARDARGISVEGKRAALLYWPAIPYQPAKDHQVARFEESDALPSFDPPAPVREGEGRIGLRLTEAVPWPLTVTTQAIVGGNNQADDWENSGATVIVPAGHTSFDPGLIAVDDHLSEGDHEVALELTISGNGHSEVRRLAVRLEDNDRVMLADVPHAEPNLGRSFAPVSGAWAYRPDSVNADVWWTGQTGFKASTPYDYPAAQTFGEEMAGSGDWLAVTQGSWGGHFGTARSSSIFLYQPAVQTEPLRTIKGMKWSNRFGAALFARGDSLWVGAPGVHGVNGSKKIAVAGAAFEYSMLTGKKVRTFKAPKTHAMNFGAGITANDSSVWIASPAHLTRGGAVHQYSRATGKWQRTLPVELGGEASFAGCRMTANADTVVLISSPVTPAAEPASLHGYAASSGTHSWTITPPDSTSFSAVEMLRDDLLVVAGRSLCFYRLTPGAEPELQVEIRRTAGSVSKLRWNGRELMLMDGTSGYFDWTSIDLTRLPQLAEFFPASTAARESVAAVSREAAQDPAPAAIGLVQQPDGWLLNFGAEMSLAGNPGGQVSLETSIDLAIWETVARHDPLTGWLPTVEWMVASEGNSLKIQRHDTTRYFRLRLEPVKE